MKVLRIFAASRAKTLDCRCSWRQTATFHLSRADCMGDDDEVLRDCSAARTPGGKALKHLTLFACPFDCLRGSEQTFAAPADTTAAATRSSSRTATVATTGISTTSLHYRDHGQTTVVRPCHHNYSRTDPAGP